MNSARTFLTDNTRFVAGRLDGKLQFFYAKTGQPVGAAVNK